MLRTLDCEGAVLACRTFVADGGTVEAAPGAVRLLDRLPSQAWAVLAAGAPEEVGAYLDAAALPRPAAVHGCSADAVGDRLRAAEALGVDPFFCLAVEDDPAGVDAALGAGMKVVGVATHHEPVALGAADMVIPSLRSLHVVGRHPVLVLEVDAVPDVGTFNPGAFNPGTYKRR